MMNPPALVWGVAGRAESESAVSVALSMIVAKRSRRPRGWYGSALLACAFVGTLFTRPLFARGSSIDTVVFVLAWPVFIVGGFMRLWGTLYVGGRKDKRLVTDGPYSICRNPLYVGSLLLGISLAMFLKSGLFLVAIVAVSTAYAAYLVPHEEQRLLRRFGRPYEDYRRQTPRFIPRLGRFHSPSVIRVSVWGLGRELQRACGWALLPLVGEVVSYVRYADWWPHLAQRL
jgi:protein-S-isoprenylcysteine O-methyltransferase Ste14